MTIDLDELSAAERILLVQELWDSVVSDAESLPLTLEERRWVDERVGYADRLDAEWAFWHPTLLSLRVAR